MNFGNMQLPLTTEFYICKGEYIYLNGDKLYFSTNKPNIPNYFTIGNNGYYNITIGSNYEIQSVSLSSNLHNYNHKSIEDEHSHSWVEYVGLVDRFDYCKDCGIKK